MSLLVAFEIVCTRFLAFENSIMRLSFFFIPLMLMGYLFGPWLAGLGGVVGDVVGMILFPKAMYFPGFTLNAFLVPFIYGLFFYQKNITLKRNVAAQITIMCVISLVLTPIWLNLLFKIPIIELMPLRIGKELIGLPVKVAVSYYLFNHETVNRLIRLRLTPVKK
ncbi:ECF transporter S component, folate family [Isobaculum melis]|uniref:ECF transporter S component, folate family n=2 Tax=Isobaculum melis TaxID=142588 RepID=A0A1H9UC33_9LACT|nr:ECF transporter S component, folate family [Isobaculum melis]